MPYRPIEFPPGFFTEGTDYVNRNRWIGGDRVRFHGQTVQAIGGWERRGDALGAELPSLLPDPATQVVRSGLSWRNNVGEAQAIFGHNGGLTYLSPQTGGTVVDITPPGFVQQVAGPTTNRGYGGWYYGINSYGTARPEGDDDVVFGWVLRAWGEDALAQPRWQPSVLYSWGQGDAEAVEVTEAPPDANAMRVTEQRIVMLGGTTQEPRRISWSDSEDFRLWTPALTNQAGGQTLSGAGRIMEIVSVRDQVLIVTETDAHTANYVGPPYIYSFDRVGANCGTRSGGAVVATKDFAVWPGERDFFIFDGSLRRMPCPVMDHVLEALNSQMAGATVGWHNSQWGEVWWLYASGETVDSYVAWDYVENNWIFGTMPRTFGMDNDIYRRPLLVDRDGRLYNHELDGVVPSENGDTTEVWAETGPLENGDGDLIGIIRGFVPDFEVTGEVDITLLGQARPSRPEQPFGPYRVPYPGRINQPVPTKARGRSIRLRVTGRSGRWTLGRSRMDFDAGGQR